MPRTNPTTPGDEKVMPSRYHIGVYRDQPLPGYVVFRGGGYSAETDSKAPGGYLREFYSREQAKALRTHLEQFEKAERFLSASAAQR